MTRLYIENEQTPGTFAKREVAPPENWIVPPECGGQIVEESYAFGDDGYLFMRIYDRSDRTETLYCVDAEAVQDEQWHPVNTRPSVNGEWRRVESFDATKGLDLAEDLTKERAATAPLLPETIEADDRGRILAGYSEGSFELYASLEAFADAVKLPSLVIVDGTIEEAFDGPTQFEVLLDVSELSGDAWEKWCEHETVENITYDALQADGYEHWTVTAENKKRAREIAEDAIGDAPVEIASVTRV